MFSFWNVSVVAEQLGMTWTGHFAVGPRCTPSLYTTSHKAPPLPTIALRRFFFLPTSNIWNYSRLWGQIFFTPAFGRQFLASYHITYITLSFSTSLRETLVVVVICIASEVLWCFGAELSLLKCHSRGSEGNTSLLLLCHCGSSLSFCSWHWSNWIISLTVTGHVF